MRACQWSGVAIITASISLSSSTRRKSSSKPGLSPCALAISAPVFSSTLGSAARFCRAHDELRDHFRARQRQGETVPLAEQRRIYLERLAAVHALLAA